MKYRWIQKIGSSLQLLVGTAMTAAAFGCVIIPQGFAAGGVTGLSRILCSVIPIPLSVMVYAINIPLLILAWVFMGRAFALRTVTVSLLFPAMLEVFSQWQPGFGEHDIFISALLAGGLLGVGSGLVLRSNASSGGFDNLGAVLNKRFGWSVSSVVRICDCSVLLVQAVSQPLMPTIYGILVIFVTTYCITWVVTMGTGETQVTIFSGSFAAIGPALMKELDVGVTYLNAESGYQGNAMKVIVSVMPYRKIAQMKRIVNAIDPKAFVVVDEIRSVLGERFTFDQKLL